VYPGVYIRGVYGCVYGAVYTVSGKRPVLSHGNGKSGVKAV